MSNKTTKFHQNRVQMSRRMTAANAAARLSPASTAVMEAVEGRRMFSTFAVTTTADSGAGSLRDAIVRANAKNDADVITFAIGSGAKTITPLSQLPYVKYATNIDATTQPGYTGRPLIEVRGDRAGSAYGLQLGGGKSAVKGLIINRFIKEGVLIVNGGGNTISGNWIGLNNAGSAAAPNGGKGIVVNSPNNTIGGTTPATRNVISGNLSSGLQLYNAVATGNRVTGNYIGTDATGQFAVPNGRSGIAVNAAPGNVIGGTTVGAGNVISGNKQDGIVTNGGGNSTLIQQNIVGLNATGTTRLGNGWYGIETSDKNTFIGGTSITSRNIVSANGYSGIVLWKTTGSYSTVVGNYVGTDITGTRDLGNTWCGIEITNGSSNNKIGGSATGERNIVSGNDQCGIKIYQGNNNTITGNYIGTNANGLTPLKNNGDGIRLLQTANATIRSNKVAYNGGYGVFNSRSTSCTLSGNTFIDDALFNIRQ